MTKAPSITEIRAAAARIEGFVRQTPLLAAAPARKQPDLARGLLLKLESLQVTGSFKARGAINGVLTLPAKRLRRGIVTASGGNHGLAVAYAGWAVGVPATVFLPRSVAADKLVKLDDWGAEVVVVGETWDESNAAALQHAEAEDLAYIHPFADPAVICRPGNDRARNSRTGTRRRHSAGRNRRRWSDFRCRRCRQSPKARHPHYRCGARRRADPPRKHCCRTSRRAGEPRHRCGHLGAAPQR